MKIAIASDDGKTIASHFGRTKGFAVFEVEGEQPTMDEYRSNTFTGHARGLAGASHEIDRHGPILTALSDCQVVISHGMGQRMYADLQAAGITVLVTDETDVQRALELYMDGALVDRPKLRCSDEHQ